ncbi:MAG: GGDEF domain-containing protein [Campylobacterales bacterium]|nr:GGDEF domain-containing protein [Campylobacterales bacterium]MBN2832864.1 GGDEF domain-containing protein [Campylobacterales bacterium]
MYSFLFLFELLLLGVGVVFLVLSLTPIKQLISEFPEGKLKAKWKILRLLIFVFIVGYFLFEGTLWMFRDSLGILSLIPSLLLFLGGIFVFFVGQLALKTTNDVKDLAVLKQESITDALTGLRNRRYFDQRISEEVALSTRYKLPLTLMLIDVDHFKKINDTYGHTVGDEVLQTLSKIIQNVVRDSDIVARYGGEEIVIITPNTTKEEAAILAERLREKVEQTKVATIATTQEVVQVTISIGLCSLSPIITDKEALLEESDQSLYLAKKYGRNRVVVSNW